MEDTGTDTNIIILDACRNNPFERAWTRSLVSRGLAPVYAPKGTLIAYATSPGQTASDGDGRNGAYTASLLQHLDAVDCSIETMFKRVRNTLSATTDGKQFHGNTHHFLKSSISIAAWASGSIFMIRPHSATNSLSLTRKKPRIASSKV